MSIFVISFAKTMSFFVQADQEINVKTISVYI